MTTIYAISKTTTGGTRNTIGRMVGSYATKGEMIDELSEMADMDRGSGYKVEFLTEYAFTAKDDRETAVYVGHTYTEGQ